LIFEGDLPVPDISVTPSGSNTKEQEVQILK